MLHCAIAYQDFQAIHLADVRELNVSFVINSSIKMQLTKLQKKIIILYSQMPRNHLQTLVIRHHVEQMLFARNEMGLVLVHVYQNTLEIHTRDAGQNVFLILIAIEIRLARTTDARTLVREHVALMPNVGLLITLQLALVLLDILETL